MNTQELVRRIPVAMASMTVQLGPALLTSGGWAKFARHPARRALAGVAAVAAGAAAANGVNAASGTREVRRQRISIPLIGVSILAGRILAPRADRGPRTTSGDALRWLGVGVYALGVGLFEWPRHVMGHQYSVNAAIQPGHELVTRGPYSIVRHPGYTGLLLFQGGYALVFRSAAGLATLVPLAAVIRWRVADEEALLESEFGDDYRAYKRRTSRFVPSLR